MAPISPRPDGLCGRSGNAEAFCDLPVRSRGKADRHGSFWINLGEAIAFAFRTCFALTPLGHHVRDIISGCPDKNVIGVNAGSDIAFVAAHKVCGDRGHKFGVKISMREPSHSIPIPVLAECNDTVAVPVDFALVSPAAVFIDSVSTQYWLRPMAGISHLALLSRVWLGLVQWWYTEPARQLYTLPQPRAING